jgi:hypothetical protein
MQIYKCYVPRNQYYYAKDLCVRIYNLERKHYPDLTDAQYDRMLARIVRNVYQKEGGMRSLVDILTEYLEELKKANA